MQSFGAPFVLSPNSPALSGRDRRDSHDQYHQSFSAASAAIGALAAPAAAQYYPQPTYSAAVSAAISSRATRSRLTPATARAISQGYSQNPVQQIIDSLLGNRYNVTDRQAVSRCASAALTQAQAQYGGGYSGYGNGYGYHGQQ